MAKARRQTTKDTRMPWLKTVLDRSQPFWQAGATVILLDTHRQQQRQRGTEDHDWWCPCVRQN